MLKEWDSLYGEGATLKRIARFRRPAIMFGAVLIGAVIAVFLTYGRTTVPPHVRSCIAAVVMASLTGFLFSACMLLLPWLLSFADPPKVSEAKAVSKRRKRKRA